MANKRNLFFIIILIIVFLSLNAGKFFNQSHQVEPVWNDYEKDYYQLSSDNEGNWLISKIKNFKRALSPSNLIYNTTGIRPKIPITYLKREIPFLTFYNPGALEKAENLIYKASKEPVSDDSTQKTDSNNRVIKLKFDLSNSSEYKRDNINEEAPDKKPNIQVKNDETRDSDVNRNINSNERKVIAIYHTHTSETYMDDSRPQDNNGHVMPGKIGNVARVGREMARILSQRYNFKVIHTTRVHDKSYARSYLNSRQTVKEILKDNPEIDLLLDIHRDGIKEASREDVVTRVNGERAAKVMIVVTNGSLDFAHLDLDDHHQEWEKNLEFARNMVTRINTMYPNLLNRLEIRDTTYNQDLHPHALLLEVGDYRNTTSEALNSASLLADVIAAQLLSE